MMNIVGLTIEWVTILNAIKSITLNNWRKERIKKGYTFEQSRVKRSTFQEKKKKICSRLDEKLFVVVTSLWSKSLIWVDQWFRNKGFNVLFNVLSNECYSYREILFHKNTLFLYYKLKPKKFHNLLFYRYISSVVIFWVIWFYFTRKYLITNHIQNFRI